MPSGTVKASTRKDGYGFITQPDDEDGFVRDSNVEGEGFESLEEGHNMEFEICPGRTAPAARNVKVV